MADQLAREGLATMEQMLGAYMSTFAAELQRHNRRDEETLLSPAEMQLAIDLAREGVEGWTQQEPIGPYAADFYFPEQRLVVEVDGKFHEEQKKYDAERDRRMVEEFGVKYVLRIRAIDVFAQGVTAVNAIRYVLNTIPA